tara:strand:- start:1156 stop:1992 length:837 start_codon:yes stop_codon:yes gene_type:complete
MGVAYDSEAFWSIIFTRTGSVIPRVLPNSILLLIWPAILCTIDELHKLEGHGFGAEELDPGIMSEWVGLLIGMMIAFRISDAYDKWRTANRLVLELHLHTRDVIGRLCAYLPQGDPAVLERIKEMRRMLVLACVLIKMHCRNENDFSEHLHTRLILEEEHKQLTRQVCSIASMPGGDNKKDRFPSRNRPAWAFHMLQLMVANLYRDGIISEVDYHLAIDEAIHRCSATFEEVENLALTTMPFGYAQVTRLITLLYLVALPLSAVSALHWCAAPLGPVS